MAERLTIRMLGSASDNEDLRLGDLIETLNAVRTALKHTERIASGKRESGVYFRVVDLSHSSPSTVVLEPVSDGVEAPTSTPLSGDIVRRFISSMDAIVKKRRPQGVDAQAMTAYRDVGDVLRRHVSTLVFESDEQQVPVDSAFFGKVDELMGKDEIAEGSISGVLEKLNLHNAARFDIYPVVGPSHVVCEFPKELRDDVIAAVDRYVEVFGTLRYKELSPFPYAIKVKRIDVMPPVDTLPTLASLRGIAPRATGDLSAAEFVYELRHES